MSGIRSPNDKPDIKARMGVVVEGGKGWWPGWRAMLLQPCVDPYVCMLSIPCLVKNHNIHQTITHSRVVGTEDGEDGGGG